MPRRVPPLHMQILKNYRKMRGRSTLTVQKNRGNIVRFCKLVYKLYGLEHIHHLSQKHVVGVFQHLRQKGLSKSTLASYATAARLIAEHIGKPEIVPSNKELGAHRSIEERYKPVIPNERKIQAIREALYQKATWLGLAHDMRTAFGLRTKESLLSAETVNENGQRYLIVRGAKGGKPRKIPITTKEQEETIARVHQFLKENPEWISLIPPEMTLKEAWHYQKNVLYAIGATKANNANAHSLRHRFASNMLIVLEPKELAKTLGHGRTCVLKHYISAERSQSEAQSTLVTS